MTIFKCKMCGGDLEINTTDSVCTCEYCGTEQTLPRLDSDKKANLYDRANHFRRNNDFDKAMGIYEQILNEDNTDAEAYWSLVLCRYGIEYVEDPSTHKRIPTINRSQYTSIYADEDYKAALEHAAAAQKIVYEQEAKTIDEIQKGILAISEKEEPFDVFICYKETDENGRRTPDSVLANELYHQLIQEGFKVFFSKITLEDKLGQEYEPYIFAALNSAKVMVVLGTKPAYFGAVWVRNEWSRYLALIRSGAKKMLIPAYKDMDPYDLPEEFSHLQAQDMSKLGFMQDLIRGIKKIIGTEQPQTVLKETVVVQQGGGTGNTNALIKRGNIALEDGEWDKADEFFEEVLNQDAECAEAYLGKFLAEYKAGTIPKWIENFCSRYETNEYEKLEACPEQAEHIVAAVARYKVPGALEADEIREQYVFDRTYPSTLLYCKNEREQQIAKLDEEKLFVRARKYATGDIKEKTEKMIAELIATLDRKIVDAENADAESITNVKSRYADFIAASDAKVMKLYEQALAKQEAKYNSIVSQLQNVKGINELRRVKSLFEGLNGYKNSEELANKCQVEVDRLLEFERLETEKRREARKQAIARQERKTKIIAITTLAACMLFIGWLIISSII